MIRIENTNTYGWEAALRGMRNPMNSWDRSDSKFVANRLLEEIGEKDLELAQKLADAGPVHGKFLRMITVTCDITAPLYWWKEFDTYKIGTVRNSCSTMHKIHAKEFTKEDFSTDHMLNHTENVLEVVISCLNTFRSLYLDDKYKTFWWQMIQLLPSSYNQLATVQMNYAVLRNIYQYRKNHKLDEWQEFCKWILTLPYPELITGEENGN